jgi:hypothetical protein
MKGYVKVIVFVCLLIFSLKRGQGQTSSDSTTAKKTVLQKKSHVFTRIELGFPAGYIKEETAFDEGLLLSATVGYSIKKNLRVGIGTEGLWFYHYYIPAFASIEIGGHTKKVNPALNINVGYAFMMHEDTISDYHQDVRYNNGFLVEVLPMLSIATEDSKARIRFSLGGQLLSTSYSYHYTYDSNIWDIEPGPPPVTVFIKYSSLRANLLLKLGLDF